MLDYIVVGSGLAAIAFIEQLEKGNKSYIVISDNSQNASLVAAGLYNPVVLKRFTSVWNAKSQLEIASDYYAMLEEKLNIKLDYRARLLRKFTTVREQNDWFTAADKDGLSDYLSLKLVQSDSPFVPAPFQFGEVLASGFVDTKLVVQSYRNHLLTIGTIVEETFDYSHLLISDCIEYQSYKAHNIVFAEGFGIQNNPYFKNIPLDGTKGELLIIQSKQLQLKNIVKSSIFIIPLGNDVYRVGANYDRLDKTSKPTQKAKNDLIEELNKLILSSYVILKHEAGIRPTVRDRRPIIGRHPKHKAIFVLNGLGTRGVMLAPAMANNLYEFIENNTPLDITIDVQRFKKWMRNL